MNSEREGHDERATEVGLIRHETGLLMTRIRNITFFALTTLLLGCAAPALAADSPVNDAYGDPASKLPFSGLDLGLIAAGGIVLVVLGFGLRRATHTQS